VFPEDRLSLVIDGTPWVTHVKALVMLHKPAGYECSLKPGAWPGVHNLLPPALRKVWPALVSQIVIVMLGSAVCGQISTQELTYVANLIQSRNFRSFEAFIVATVIYLALSMALRKALNWAGPRFLFQR
jgi:ABC-type arginine/histidine transport system permease subunit